MNLEACQVGVNLKSRTINGHRSLKAKRRSKKGKTATHRSGYKDENGQVYLAPVGKRSIGWKEEMAKKGFTFED